MMKSPDFRSFPALIAGLTLSWAAAGIASDSPQLILQSDAEDDVVIALNHDFPVKIDAVTGDILVTPLDAQACAAEIQTCDDVKVSIDQFGLSSSTVTQGGKVTASWDVRGGWECGGAGLPGSNWNTDGFPRSPKSSVSISTIDVVPGKYNVNLLCRNGPVAAQLARSLTVDEATDGDFDTCPDRQPPAGMSIEPNPKLVTVGTNYQRRTAVTWKEMYGDDFPKGNNGFVGIDPHRYMTLEVKTGTLGSKGEIVFSELQYPFVSGFKLGAPVATISECPGDFGPQPNARCHRSSVTNFRWARDDVASGFDCPVGYNATLYFNVTYGKSGTVFDGDGKPNPDLEWGCGTHGDTESCGSNTLPTYVN